VLAATLYLRCAQFHSRQLQEQIVCSSDAGLREVDRVFAAIVRTGGHYRRRFSVRNPHPTKGSARNPGHFEPAGSQRWPVKGWKL